MVAKTTHVDDTEIIARQLADLTREVQELANQLKTLRERADSQEERADTQQERIDLAVEELTEVSARLQAAAGPRSENQSVRESI